ncbi:MAG: hypothetical protein ACRD2B_15920 [Terriglobia bacterium]
MKAVCVALITMLLGAAISASAQKKAVLSEVEVEKLRDAQDPSARIKVYLDFMHERYAAFQQLRAAPIAAPAKTGAMLNHLLVQYVRLDDEMKDWIQYQYNREGDMRGGLHALLDEAPGELQGMRQARQSPAAYTDASAYAADLENAIADLQDTLDGATTALADQEKKLGRLARAQKEDRSASKTAIKEEKKRIKEEEQLRKKEEKHQSDQ